jgi:hypothetical protein
MREASMLNATRFCGPSMIENYLSLYDKVRNETFMGHQLNSSTDGESPAVIRQQQA